MSSLQLILLASLFFLPCTSCSTQETPAPIQSATLKTGPSLRTLNMFDKLRFSDNVSITFNSVIDERCPLEDVCGEAGEAYAGFLVEQSGKPDFSVSLSWNAVFNHDPALRYKQVAGYRMYLMSLKPTRPTDEPVPAKEYKAELKIELDQ